MDYYHGYTANEIIDAGWDFPEELDGPTYEEWVEIEAYKKSLERGEIVFESCDSEDLPF